MNAKDSVVEESSVVGEIGEDAIVGGTMLDASMTEEIAAGILIAAPVKMMLPRLRPMLETNFGNSVFHVTLK